MSKFQRTGIAVVAAAMALANPAFAAESKKICRGPASVDGVAACTPEPEALPKAVTDMQSELGSAGPMAVAAGAGTVAGGLLLAKYFLGAKKYDLSSCAGATRMLLSDANMEKDLAAFKTLDDMKQSIRRGIKDNPNLKGLTAEQAKELEASIDDFVNKASKGQVTEEQLDRVASRLRGCFKA